MHFSALFTVAALAASTIAHPGHDIRKEIEAREAAMVGVPRDLSHCAEEINARGLEALNVARRALAAKKAREAEGLDEGHFLRGRDYNTVLNTNHKSSNNYTPATSEAAVFASNASCVLSADVTEGPYYVAGEFIRSDVRDGQAGIKLVLDTQVLDYKTCKPVNGALLEIWHANSTGVYSGINANGNGNSADTSNARSTAGRGLQLTDAQGVAQFTTNFPGWYTGRAVHIHVLAHIGSTVLGTGRYTGGTNSHVGQLFFDQTLITDVSKVTPYSINKQTLTTNANDGIFKQQAATSDPVVNYALLGSTVADGIFSWISFGVDTTKNVSARPAVSLAASITPSGAGIQATPVAK